MSEFYKKYEKKQTLTPLITPFILKMHETKDFAYGILWKVREFYILQSFPEISYIYWVSHNKLKICLPDSLVRSGLYGIWSSLRHFIHKLQVLIWGVLKFRERFLNFAPLTSASEQWAPALSKRMIEIGLLCIKISCP